jgi:hypothetical protein
MRFVTGTAYSLAGHMSVVGEPPQERSCETGDKDGWSCERSAVARDSVEMINEVFEFREVSMSQVDTAPIFPRLTLKNLTGVNFQTASCTERSGSGRTATRSNNIGNTQCT